ncbi:T9SS type A sorting domain-containing protein [Hymenobacter wooponensis]|uniref:T9SS type A sorting domain-containing protein n=1 Tax=Hymenobacter wooponensis TaxID=1525360 RepID=UPI0014368730|nr:T9SS type A sorting domain-containing protein [Hymenobacter wooponensis]
MLQQRALAQKEATYWFFGDKGGWDFSAGAPRPITGSAMTTTFPSVVISDGQTGELLFYSNGEQVWNRQHQVMPHGEGLPTFRDVFQGALTLPVPGQPQQYYLFTLGLALPPPERETNLFYSRIDMGLAGGLGDVVETEKNRHLPGTFTEQLTAIRHANGRDYWVLVHEWPGAYFQVFLVDPAGVRLAQRVAVGPELRRTDFFRALSGFLRASPDGRHLAYSTPSLEIPLSLFDFDPATGNISHFISLGQLFDGGGVAFSPDNTKLYAQDYRFFNRERRERNVVVQYDLQAGDDAAIAASGQSVVAGNPATNINSREQSVSGFYAWQLGLDGRLYGASGYEDATTSVIGDKLYVIPYPNRRGYACGIRYQTVDFRPGSLGPGLPNFLQHYFNGLEAPPEPESPCEQAEVSIFPNPTTESFRVQVGDGCAAPYRLAIYDALGRRILVRSMTETAQDKQVNIAFLAAGVYWVEVQVGSASRSCHKLLKY